MISVPGYTIFEKIYESPRSLERQLIEARNQVEIAETNLEAARAQHDLVLSGPSQEEIEAAEAQVKQAKAALNIIKDRESRLVIDSPASGIISQVNLEEGSLVSSEVTTPPVTIISSTMQIDLTVNENIIVNIEEGMEVEVSIPAVDELMTGKIIHTAVARDEEKGGFPVEVEINLSEDKFKPGMYAAVELPEKEAENVLLVSRQAVFQEGLNHYVYTVDNDNIVKKTRVELGLSTENKHEVVSGLEEGAKVIIRGQNMVSEGDKVEVMVDENF